MPLLADLPSSRKMSGRAVLTAWLVFVAAAYAATLTFITPPTDEARLGTSVLFLLCGINFTCAGIIGWAKR